MTDANAHHAPKVSARGAPRFECFRDDADGLYYFHYIDATGAPLLHSQGYQSEKSRDNALKTARECLPDPKRYRQEAGEGGFYFVLRAGNNREIARSRPFSGKKEMAAAMASCREAETGRGDAPEERSPESQARRRLFKLTFRRQSADAPLSGHIEYPLLNEQLSFQGLDLNAIGGFLERFLPPVAAPEAETADPKTQLRLPADFQILERDHPVGQRLAGHPEKLEVKMSFPAESGRTFGYRARVYARSLQRGTRNLIGEEQGLMPGDGTVTVPLLAGQLPPDIYRIIATVDVSEDPQKTAWTWHWEQSRMLLVS